MEYLAAKLTQRCLRFGFIDAPQEEWCQYTLQTYITNVGGFLILIAFGIFLSPWPQVLILNLGVAFLRSKCGGLHMPTASSCFLISLLFESICLFVLPHLTFGISLFLLLVSLAGLFCLAPCNNDAIHCDGDELKKMREEVLIRLILVVFTLLVLFLCIPGYAYPLVLSCVVVMVSVALSKLGFGIQ